MNPLTTLLREHPFCQGLAEPHLTLMEGCTSRQEFHSREKLFVKGQEARSFYLLTRGEVTLETPFIPGEGVISVQTLGAGEALGWSWLFPPHEWNFSVRALEPTEALVLDARLLRELAEENPAFGYALALRVGHVLSQRLQNTRTRLLSVCETG